MSDHIKWKTIRATPTNVETKEDEMRKLQQYMYKYESENFRNATAISSVDPMERRLYTNFINENNGKKHNMGNIVAETNSIYNQRKQQTLLLKRRLCSASSRHTTEMSKLISLKTRVIQSKEKADTLLEKQYMQVRQ